MSQRPGGEGTMQRQNQGVRGQGFVVGTCLLSLVVAGGAAVSWATEPASVPTNAGQSTPQSPNQERFLDNFTSQRLGQGAAPTATSPTPLSPSSQLSAASSQPPALNPQPSPPQAQPAAPT